MVAVGWVCFLCAARGAAALSAVVVGSLVGAAVVASELPAGLPGCALGVEPQAVSIAKVIDGDTLRLADGRSVRLTGIEAPRRPLGWPEDRRWPLAEAAQQGLAAWVADRAIMIAFVGDAPDRHGRWHGQAFLGKERVWLQAALVTAGLARVRGLSAARACVTALLAQEAQAREKGLGLWTSGDYAAREADDPSLISREGLYEIVEGRVTSVKRGSYMTFVDFGRDYRRDFTIMVPPATVRRLGEADVEIEALTGRWVRVRGTIESSGGPAIRLTDPADLELVDGVEDEGRG